MADPIRGGALFRADIDLAAPIYVPHPRQPDYSRAQYSASPPSYRSRSPPHSTQSQSAPGDEEQRREKQRWQIRLQRRKSSPYYQFDDQVREEEDRIFKADRRWLPGETKPSDRTVTTLAKETVKSRWVKQGIWNDKWHENLNRQRWEHQEPLELDLEPGPEMGRFGVTTSVFMAPRQIQPKSDEDLRLDAERRRKEGLEREASRPFHQFLYQLSKERERMQDDSRRPDGPNLDTLDINTKAYDIVRGIWTRRGIWDTQWGILPGMSWKHERPLEQLWAEEMVPEPPRQVDPPERNGGGAYPAPSRIFGPFPPAQSNHSSVSDLSGSSQQPPTPQGLSRPPRPADLNSNVSGVSDISQRHPPAVSNLAGIQDARSATGLRSRRANRAPSPREGRAAGTALGLARPAKVSKPPRRKKGSAPRPRAGSKASLENAHQPPLPKQDIPKPSPPSPPRRSRRIQELQSTKASTDPAAVAAATSVVRGVSLSRPRRTTAGGSPKSVASAKPQGISKRRQPSTRRPRPNQARVPPT